VGVSNEYKTGEKEFYDLRSDRYQLNNLAKTANPNLLKALAARLQKLHQCTKASCCENQAFVSAS
jgi:N-acetylglucosamine-6-sulfatase